MAGNERYSFKNLELWKLAQEFATEACRLADSLPAKRSADVVARQLIRSATSISANISEGHARFTYGAYRNHLSIARGSTAESENWIDLLLRMGHVSPEVAAPLEKRCILLTGALTRHINALERRAGQASIREDGPTYSSGENLTEAAGVVPLFDGSIVPAPVDDAP